MFYSRKKRGGINVAFFGIALLGTAFILCILAVFFTGLILIIAGAVMQRKNLHRKLATVLKIIGYFLVIPIVFIILLFAAGRFM